MDLLGFGIALLVVSAAPGPVVAVLTVRTLAGNAGGAARFALGSALGKVAILLVLLTGLGALLGHDGAATPVLRALGVLYLSWVALGLWRDDGREPAALSPAHPGGAALDLGAGLAASLSSPLLLVFFLSALPTAEVGAVPPLPSLVSVTLLASACGHGAYILLASRLRPLLAHPLGRRRLCRSMSAATALAAVWLALA